MDLFAELVNVLNPEPKGARSKGAKNLFQPSLDLALCIGPEAQPIKDLASDLGSDLEEMRWDRGSGAHGSKIIPELDALVNEAGDPYAVEPAKLEALVQRHSAPLGSAKAIELMKAIESYDAD